MHEFLKTDQLGHIINQVNDEISMLKNALNEPINKNVESLNISNSTSIIFHHLHQIKKIKSF